MSLLSECCSAHPWGEIEYGICGNCYEHCGFYDEDEYAPKADRQFSSAQLAIIEAIMAEAERIGEEP